MRDPAAIQAANAIMDRLDPLDMTIANAIGFRVLLENLHGRDLSGVTEPHVQAIHMVRAGVLRAAIGAIMAAVDRRGTDRASIGQIVHMSALPPCDGFDLCAGHNRMDGAGFELSLEPTPHTERASRYAPAGVSPASAVRHHIENRHVSSSEKLSTKLSTDCNGRSGTIQDARP